MPTISTVRRRPRRSVLRFVSARRRRWRFNSAGPDGWCGGEEPLGRHSRTTAGTPAG
jgi:hypothetical protein